jgi:DNA modification methylase
MSVTVLHGDNRELILTLAASSIDSVVTDPPYALVSIVKRFGADDAAAAKSNGATGVYRRAAAGFMGQRWDNGETAFDPAFWREVLRVLKPGGHVLAFGGTRTYHRLACAIEDAGFEIRDMVAWLYGSGFPKSHDVSKGIDKAAGLAEARGYIETTGGLHGGSGDTVGCFTGRQLAPDPVSADALRWNGWGTALKPALEPIVLARKPLIGTVAENVLTHGTGAINVDGCRVATDELAASSGIYKRGLDGPVYNKSGLDKEFFYDGSKGRWPANVIHDGSDEVVAGFPDAGGGNGESRLAYGIGGNGILHGGGAGAMVATYDDSGSAARFFYTAKADETDRVASRHPTVKPVDLMQYLCRLVTPPGGCVLDPFAGSGSTGEAAVREGFRAILIEREAEYVSDIKRRMELVLAGPEEKQRAIIKAKGKVESVEGLPLFGGPME